jgi:hypothetical protein
MSEKKKRKKPVSASKMSLELLRSRGYDAEVVEQRIAFFTRDLFNCVDIFAMGFGQWLGVQTTTGANAAERRAKILAEPLMRRWLENGGKLELHRWRKRGARGKPKEWSAATEEITLDQFKEPQ